MSGRLFSMLRRESRLSAEKLPSGPFLAPVREPTAAKREQISVICVESNQDLFDYHIPVANQPDLVTGDELRPSCVDECP